MSTRLQPIHRTHSHRAGRSSWKLALILCAVGLVSLALIACVALAWVPVQTTTAAIGKALADHQDVFSWIVIGFVFLAAVAAVVALFGGARVVHVWARGLYLKFQKGALADLREAPVTLGQVRRQSYAQPVQTVAQGWIDVAKLEAEHGDLDGVQHYAPSVHYEYENQALALPGATNVTPLLPAPSVTPPSLVEMIDRGWSTPDQWCLGIDGDGNPQIARLKHMGGLGIAGVQGVGKTNTETLIAAQTAVHGGVVFVGDPHAGDEESLVNSLEPLSGAVEKIAVTPAEINELILHVGRIYQRRKEDSSQVDVPVLLMLDELLELLAQKQINDEALATLAVLNSSGRKKKVNLVMTAQAWNATLLGRYAAAIRGLLTHVAVHRSAEDTAKFLLPSRYASQAVELQVGQAILLGSGFNPAATTIPLVTQADRDRASAGRSQRPFRTVRVPGQPAQQSTQNTQTMQQTTPAPAQPQTNQARIVALLGRSSWLDSFEIAQQLGVKDEVIRTELSEMQRAGVVIVRAAPQGKRGRNVYALPNAKQATPSRPLAA